jgi:hypothetical protein
VPFGKGQKLVINVPINPPSSINCYINSTPGLTVDIPGTENSTHLEATIPLAIKEAA